MKNLKKLLAVVLAVAMMLTIMVPAFAAENYSAEANKLNSLGLYKGISTDTFNPDLSSALDRQTGVTLLLRIFGLEADALALSDEDATAALAKFTDASDIADWAKKTVAYAVKNGLVVGTTETTFGAASPLNGKAYATLVLRQLGYTVDEAGYAVALSTLVEKGGVTAAQATAFDKDLIKDDVVGITFGTLNAVDSTGKKVIDNLIAEGVVTEAAAIAAGVKEAAAALSASITGAKKITVNFGKAVAEDTAIVIKKGSVTVSADKVEFADDKKSAVVTTTTYLSKGDYIVTVGDASVTLTAADEKVAKIEVSTVKAPRVADSGAGAKQAYVSYKILNQYGEKVTGQTIQWTVSTGVTPIPDDGKKITITAANGQDFVPGAPVYVTGVHTASGTVVNAQVEIGLASKSDSVVFKGVYNTSKNKLQALPADFGTNYVLLYEVNDQYGNKISNPVFSDLVFTSDAPLFIDGTFGAASEGVDVTLDDVTYEAVKLTEGTTPEKGGKATIQAISKTTGTKSTYVIEAEAKALVKTFTISAPAEIVAEGETVEIPFTAIDQFGNPVTKYDDFFADPTNYATIKVTLNPVGSLVLVSEADGSATLEYTAPATGASDTADLPVYLTTVVNEGGNFSSLMLSIKETAVPKAVVGIDKDKVTSIARGNTTELAYVDFQIQDQYGRILDDEDVKDWLDLPNTSIVISSLRPGPTDNSPFYFYQNAIATDVYDVVLADGGDDGLTPVKVYDYYATLVARTDANLNATEAIKVRLSTNDAGGTLTGGDDDDFVAGSDKSITFTKIEKSQYASYEVKDFEPMYNDGVNGAHDDDYDKTVVVYGVLPDGTKVKLPASDFTVTENVTELTTTGNVIADNEGAGYLITDNDFKTTQGEAKDIKVTVLVTVKDNYGAAIEILEKTLTVSNADIEAATITLDSKKVKDGKAVVKQEAAPAPAGTISPATLKALVKEIKDNYGVAYANNPTTVTISKLTKVDGSSFMVANNGTATAAISGAKLGDKFTVTLKYDDVSVSVDVTVGIVNVP